MPREQYQELVIVDWNCLNCGYHWSVISKLMDDGTLISLKDFKLMERKFKKNAE